MSYQVIARKYRPQRFEDVVGQEHVTQTLANAIKAGRIAHAYLFCGPRGTGKTTLARIFAKALNCTGGPNADFDDNDPRVQEITQGRSLDVLEIDGASNNGVDQVRELRETARFAPASSKYKIYIIDEVHMLSTAAFNALLKTLEEPPAHVKFLFATTDPEKVLITILSRCQRFDLRRIPAALIVKHLAWIAGQEGVTIDDAALHAIARGADGGMRDAESTLDQLISFCGTTIVESDVLSMFGLAARAQLLELSGAILAGQPETTLRLLDSLAKSGKDLGRLLSDLLNHFRNLLLFQVSRGDQTLIEVSEAELATLKAQAKLIETEPLTRVMEVLTTAEGRQRDATSKRIFLEVTLLKAIQAREATSLDAVLKQLKSLRDAAPQRTASVAPAEADPAPYSAPPLAPKPSPAPPPTAASELPKPAPAPAPPSAPQPPLTPAPPLVPLIAPGDKDGLFAALLTKLAFAQRTMLSGGHAIALTDRLFTIGVDAEHFSFLDPKRDEPLLTAKLSELGVGDMAVKLVPLTLEPAEPAAKPAATAAAVTATSAPPRPVLSPKSAEPKPGKAAPVQLDKEAFKNDPLIQQAVEIFKAQLIAVRAPGTEV
ncbi:MAG TPA: DNA polymerase III subunit gamma/tau [Candidatus Limnocylindria bacterium]|nr:DNA polymerase III subunit gamma/tau [Candidatus Limnocylindria bacterium]